MPAVMVYGGYMMEYGVWWVHECSTVYWKSKKKGRGFQFQRFEGHYYWSRLSNWVELEAIGPSTKR